MPDISTLFRDYGTVPTIIALGFIALIVYSIVKGGSKGGGGSKRTGGGSSSNSNPTPPPASPS